MKPKRLLAKSYSNKDLTPPDYALLTQHSRDVAAACRALAEIIGATALNNAGLSSSMQEDFSKTLIADGWMQDIGKANSHFIEMVSGFPEITQMLRHETISGLLFWLEPQLSEWIKSLKGVKIIIAIWGAMGHHRKFHAGTFPKETLKVIVHTNHEDFNTILCEMAQDLTLSKPPVFNAPLTIEIEDSEDCDFSSQSALKQLIKDFQKHESEFASEESRRFLALIKALGIAADVAASAVAKKYQSASQYSLRQFVIDDLSKTLLPNSLRHLIRAWAWNQIDSELKPSQPNKLPLNFGFREFQKNVARSKSHLTLAQAGCGSGKSLAAYLWALFWCKRFEKEERPFRLFFCLPTTGTTTEHFKDYALESGIPDNQISLTHSRSSVDLETIATTANQEETLNDDTRNASQIASDVIETERDKIEALALWSTQLTVTTTDTILGLMANARKPIYSIPAIMQSAIIFDEVHAFDDRLFGHLLVFLKNFPNLPVLLMTASLPKERLKAIQNVRPDLNIVPGPKNLESLERYQIKYPATDQEIWTAVKDTVAQNGKVLWVCNRVDWANDIYNEAKKKFSDISVNVYHSRFRYKDRSYRHRQVIDDFKQEGKAAILVATQVAEMSLDLSADLLITDIAPVPALIQRMGRLNRRATPSKPTEPKPCFIRPIVDKKDIKPYEEEELETAKNWIAQMISLGKPLSQKDLADGFAAVSKITEYDYAKAAERACFFGVPKKSGIWRTQPGTTRGEGYTINVILEEDYKNCNEFEYGKPSRDWLRKHEVAIPIKPEALKWEIVAGIRIAPKEFIHYDYNEDTREGTGAKWR